MEKVVKDPLEKVARKNDVPLMVAGVHHGVLVHLLAEKPPAHNTENVIILPLNMMEKHALDLMRDPVQYQDVQHLVLVTIHPLLIAKLNAIPTSHHPPEFENIL